MMKVKEVAETVGISVRTLHHYDQIGLLVPSETTEAGYRLYSEDDLTTLQQILFFRELGFQLKEIKQMIHNPSFDREEAFLLQRKMLIDKREKITLMIETIDQTLKHMKGEINMTHEEKFAGFNFEENPYEQEARKRWGDQSVDASKEKLSKMTKDEQKSLARKMEDTFKKMVSLMHLPPEDENVQSAMGDWYQLLNSLGHHYSLEAFAGLGQMYVQDERFTKNIDKFGEGLAQFMSEAMGVYAENNQED